MLNSDDSCYSVVVATVSLSLDTTSYNETEGVPNVQVCVVGEVGTGNLDDIAGETFEVNVSLFDGTAIGMHNVYM